MSLIFILITISLAVQLTFTVNHTKVSDTLLRLDRVLAYREHHLLVSQVILLYFKSEHYLKYIVLKDFDAEMTLNALLPNLQPPPAFSVQNIDPDAAQDDTGDGVRFSEASVGYVIIARHHSTVISSFKLIINRRLYWNPRANFFVLLESKVNQDNYTSLLQTLWKTHNILNVILMSLTYETKFYFYNPFSSPNDTLEFCKVAHFERCESRVKNKLDNMRGYPIRISMFERNNTALRRRVNGVLVDEGVYDGSDGLALQALAAYMNFKPATSVPADHDEYGDLDDDTGVFTGSLGDIIYGRADIAFNTRFLKEYSSDEVVFAKPISTDLLCVVVPKAKRMPKWLTMILAFQQSLYIMLFVMIMSFTALWYVFKRFRMFYRGHWTAIDVTRLLLDSFQPFASVSMGSLPKHSSERILLISCILLGFIVVSCFQGKLLEAVTKPFYYLDIETLEQLDKSGLIITTGSSNLEDTFQVGTDNPVMNHLKRKTIVNASESTLVRVSKYNIFAGIARKSDIVFRFPDFLTAEGTPLLTYVKECPRSYYLSFMLPKQSAYLSKINEFNSRIFEAGLVDFWDELTIFKLIHKERTANETATADGRRSSNLKVFTVQDLQMPFYLLLMGLISSTCLFGLELLYYYFVRKLCEKGQHRIFIR